VFKVDRKCRCVLATQIICIEFHRNRFTISCDAGKKAKTKILTENNARGSYLSPTFNEVLTFCWILLRVLTKVITSSSAIAERPRCRVG